MMAICPAGPPKLIKPSFSQKRKASQKVTGAGASSAGLGAAECAGAFIAKSNVFLGILSSFAKVVTQMAWIVSKYLITAALVVLVSELAKRSDKLGALVASLPLVTVLTLVWLYIEKAPDSQISNHAYYTFWYVIPTLPMFLAFPYLMSRFGFWMALLASVIITLVCFLLTAKGARMWGVELL